MEPTALFELDNRDGWMLDLKHYRSTNASPRKRPILIIPGYCMNTFILAYHPRGKSLVEYLCNHGFEVFTANLRGQGDSKLLSHGSRRIGFRELGLVDLPHAIDFVLGRTSSEQLHLIGCSLGGTIAYSYLAHRSDRHRLRTMVAMGAPLRWDSVNPFLKFLFSSRRVAALVDVRGTRRLALAALPIAKRIPKLLDMYMNASHIDLTRADQLVRTVDDPIAHLNIQIVNWLKSGQLIVDGKNVGEALRAIDLPLLNIFANADGIVPPDAARSIAAHLGSKDLMHLEAGDADTWYAHADMFIGHTAEQRVFEPMAAWLGARD
jgi:poly(3-hydroxyalkanoate) synthetase